MLRRSVIVGFLLAFAQPACLQAAPFTAFESGQTRPLAISPDGTRLFALNTPDNRLEIFAIDTGTPIHLSSVPVGLEPVAVAARNDSEVWVVNHLSDSVSIVDVSTTPAVVERTLLVGDEPRDIVFAGAARDRAFITTAHRGQNRPGFDPQLTTPSVPRADVFVFDAQNLGSSLEGSPLVVLSLFTDTPRALAVTPDGGTVYAAGFQTGNQTTVVSEALVCDTSVANLNSDTMQGSCSVLGSSYPGGLPLPHRSSDGIVRPETGLIVQWNGSHWVDHACVGRSNRGKFCSDGNDCPGSSCGRIWDNAVKFSLPDEDVFALDANANPPVETASFRGVGTVLFNMVVNPVSGRVYVSNTHARNEVRFEGPGVLGGSTVQGHIHEARITILDGATVTARHLNKHLDYSLSPAPVAVKEKSLATPVEMAVTSDGTTLFVAAFGSAKVGVFDTAALESDAFTPNAADHIAVSGGGPAGIALDEAHHKLYVLTRFDNGLSTIDTSSRVEEHHQFLHNPEPDSIVQGRQFLYDANLTSSNGEASCSSCHVFGDFDSLAWDLGNPDDVLVLNPNPMRLDNPNDPGRNFHPMKGPMTTQSLRGMANHGPLHWRGDRTGGTTPGGDPLDESAAFEKFNVAFPGLLGRETELTTAQMAAFTDFMLQVTYPPNPIRNLDNSLTSAQAAGQAFFHSAQPSDVFQPCNGCHVDNSALGFFGSDGFSTVEGETQFFKIPHLRNLYQKIGMFGLPSLPGIVAGDNGSQGDQVRGVGFLHDGSIDTVFRFLRANPFVQAGNNPGGFSNDTQRRQVEAFLLAMNSNLKPVVGQQVTLSATNSAVTGARIDLLIARAIAGDCDLIAKGDVGAEARGWYFDGAFFHGDRTADLPLNDAGLRQIANTAGQELTYTCVPPGSGIRLAVDRDEDGAFDGDERDSGTDPADSLPSCNAGAALGKPQIKISENDGMTGDEKLTLKGQAVLSGAIDPLADGITIRVYGQDGVNWWSRKIPGGAAWSVNAKGTKWTYKDRSGSSGGITKISISDKSTRQAGLHSFVVSGKDSNFHVPVNAVPLRVVVIFGDAATCADVQFHPSGGAAPTCEVKPDGSRVTCK